ncbi:MAG: endonuclease III domain-containing protein [archaeon]
MHNHEYKNLLKKYGQQGWWPLINDKTLLCEYHPGDYSYPHNQAQIFEICIGSVLTQNTSWYPGVVRSLQQLKLGRPFTKQELEVIKQAEIMQASVSGITQKQTKDDLLTQNTNWTNVEKALLNLKEKNLLNAKEVLKCNIEEIKTAIKPSGYFNQKTRKLIEFSKFYLNLKKTPARNELLSVWGIGKETADSILLYAYKVPTFVIDAYTRKFIEKENLFNSNEEYDKIKGFFEYNLPRDLAIYQEFHALIVEDAKKSK